MLCVANYIYPCLKSNSIDAIAVQLTVYGRRDVTETAERLVVECESHEWNLTFTVRLAVLKLQRFWRE